MHGRSKYRGRYRQEAYQSSWVCKLFLQVRGFSPGNYPSINPSYQNFQRLAATRDRVSCKVSQKHIIFQFQSSKRYVYDILIPPGVDPAPFTPRPLDGEVESFEVRIPLILDWEPCSSSFYLQLVSQDKLLRQLSSGLFKPNCGLGKEICPIFVSMQRKRPT